VLNEVILVDENDTQIGTVEKMQAHRMGLLHRAFSVFVFNSDGEFLLQQRAYNKYHNGGLWTNTCCSHPFPGEEILDAAQRRLMEEMGFETPLTPLFSFIYRTSFCNGLTEHEFDHVLTGIYDGPVFTNKEEVNDFQFIGYRNLEIMLKTEPQNFTEWFKIAMPGIKTFHDKYFENQNN
jgi:isopentenyl-diphosphate Delta-isomerase